MATPKKGPSVTKTLIASAYSDPSNRSCADCWAALVDPSDVHVSLCPSLETVQQQNQEQVKVSVAIHDFRHTHRALAPREFKTQKNSDPASTVNQRLGGHGVFICSRCAEAHRKLPENVTKVIPVQDPSRWTQSEVEFMTTRGGNALAKKVYEAYMPEAWQIRRPTASSSLEERIVFCKAKYEALAFVMPPPGPFSQTAWESILERNEIAKRYMSPGLDIHSLVPCFPSGPTGQDSASRGKGGGLPDRLIDFFCVVTHGSELRPSELRKDLSKYSLPEEIQLWPHVADCYPMQKSYRDMIFPEHLPTFVLPQGCCPSSTQLTPTFYTFVLTLGDGDRIYGGALQIYDEHMSCEDLKTLILESGYKGSLPSFLDDSDIVFLPKCLILLSHYPFFDLFRDSLLQLYRISLVQSSLPIERYVANLVSEVPLPPRGKVRVEFSFPPSKIISIERPPPNQLPLANFSYRPIFASLSVGNIMVILGCLMEECKVALLSSNCSILTPVAEALLSALFPFEWQGLYIPVMPYSMLDILDAPVPFLVGLDSHYFKHTPPCRRPRNVVLVDLDRDVVYLSVDDMTDTNRKVPPLPPRDAQKLKTSLDTPGNLVYLLPRSGIKGCIMEGHEEPLLVSNDDRPKYAHMMNVQMDESAIRRDSLLGRTRKAYDENELLETAPSFRATEGQIRFQDGYDSNGSSGSPAKSLRRRRIPKFKKTTTRTEVLARSMEASGQAHLLDMTVNVPTGFSPSIIRQAFLRFMVATFLSYAKYIKNENGSPSFDDVRFLHDMGEDSETTSFVGRVLKTQMFQRFLEERLEDPDNHEVRFFDESILAKLNRSKVSKMQKGGKLPTPFLDDESSKVTRTYTSPQPNNRGLPESMETFQYTVFPILDPSAIGRIRTPTTWIEGTSQSRRRRPRRNMRLRKTEQDILNRAMNPLMRSSFAMASSRDLEAALSTLRMLKWETIQLPTSSQTRSRALKVRAPPSSASQTSVSVETDDSERTVRILSQADTIVLNARRKQAVLLDEIVLLQAVWRTHAARRRYVRLRRSILILQRKFRGIATSDLEPKSIHLLSRRVHAKILCIQRYLRGHSARRSFRQSRAGAIQIQSKLRGHLARRRYAQLQSCATTIQRSMRGKPDRLAFLAIKRLVSKMQGRVRGHLLRAKLSRILHGRMKQYRTEVITLWQACHLPLSIRTKFWPALVAPYSLVKLHVVESELQRLWKIIGVVRNEKVLWVGDDIVKVADVIGIDSSVYCRSKELGCSKDFLELLKSERKDFATSFGYEEAERLQIHERLDSTIFETKATRLYTQFALPSTDKMKKVSLARALWAGQENAEASRSTMLTLFPELDSSLAITFQPTSSKGRRRFPAAAKSAAFPLKKETWSDISLEGLIAKYSKEVMHLYITEVPQIMAKLAKREKEVTNVGSTMPLKRRVQQYLFGKQRC